MAPRNPIELGDELVESLRTLLRSYREHRRELLFAAAAVGLFLAAWWLPQLLAETPVEGAAGWVRLVLVVLGVLAAIRMVVLVLRRPLAAGPQIPLRGAAPFIESDRDRFQHLGRDRELALLVSAVRDPQVGLVLLRGPSGVGKTSLLRAGLAQARAEHPELPPVIYWRVAGDEPEERLLSSLRGQWPGDVKLGHLDQLDHLAGEPAVVVIDQLEELDPEAHPRLLELLRARALHEPPVAATWVVALPFRSPWYDRLLDGLAPEVQGRITRLSLEPLDPQRAASAFQHLMEAAQVAVSPGVARRVARDLEDPDGVSPLELTVAATGLWRIAGPETFGINDLERVGGVVGLFAMELEGQLALVPEVRPHLDQLLLRLAEAFERGRRVDGAAPDWRPLDQLVDGSADPDAARLRQVLRYLASPPVRWLEWVPAEGAGEERLRVTSARRAQAILRVTGTLAEETLQARRVLELGLAAWRRAPERRDLLSGADLRLVERHRPRLHVVDAQAVDDFLARSRRRLWQRRLLVVGLVILALAGLWGHQVWTESRRLEGLLEGWNLPPDLHRVQGQLEALALPAPVDQLRWLDPDLRELALRGNPEVTDLSRLPSGLEALDLSYAPEIRDLGELPPGLLRLILYSSGVETGIPERLEVLDLVRTEVKIGGRDRWPDGLREVAFGEGAVASLGSLPRNLEAVSLQVTRDFSNLEGLPRQLERLTLFNALNLELAPIPPSLLHLDLTYTTEAGTGEGPPAGVEPLAPAGAPPPRAPPLEGSLTEVPPPGQLDLRLLPTSLETLRLRGVRLVAPEALTRLGNLERIDLDRGAFEALAGHLPPRALLELTLTGGELAALEGRPELWGRVAALRLSDGEGAALAPLLPALGRLEILALVRYGLAGLPDLPAGLRELRLDDSRGVVLRFGDLSALPSGLEVLGLENTEVETLGALPGTLVTLELQHTEVRDLSALSSLEALTDLTLHGGQVPTLEGLPPSVRRLTFVAGR